MTAVVSGPGGAGELELLFVFLQDKKIFIPKIIKQEIFRIFINFLSSFN
jgi:hypothetical protein